MDPLTAALQLLGKVADLYLEMLRGASPEQRQQIVQLWIDDQKFWRGLVAPLALPPAAAGK